jgi:hypothetical protein
MSRTWQKGRPRVFELDKTHYLAQGLVFAGLGRIAGSTHYRDSSLYGNHGTLTNMTPATDWVWDNFLGRWVTRYATDDAVPLAGTLTGVLDFVTGPFTFTAWMKITSSAAQYKSIIGKRSSVGYQYVYRLNNNKQSLLRTGGSLDSTTSLVDSVWAHGAVAINADGSGTFYLNGVPDGTLANKSITHHDTNVYVGSFESASLVSFLGGLADVCIHNRSLSTAEIQQLADPSNAMLSGLILPPKRKIWAAVTAAPAASSRRRRLLCGAA